MAPESFADREVALAEVIGALAYGLLRVFQVTAAGTLAAPTIALRERQAAFAAEQYERYRVLRRRLGALTNDVGGAMERLRRPLDAFYGAAPTEDWTDAQVFHYIGEAITADFAGLITPFLDDRTAAAVREALVGRAAHAAFALDQVQRALASGGGEAEERVAAVAGRVIGDAISRLREGILDSDALATVLGGEEKVKELVLELLGRHRERLEMLGVDQLD
ncbi:MAG: hypothetical protein HY775_12070 [Acidobacteria bacterium]|nr:hypothetical protein [Acidobacteriota bacterium]